MHRDHSHRVSTWKLYGKDSVQQYLSSDDGRLKEGLLPRGSYATNVVSIDSHINEVEDWRIFAV